MKILPVLRNRSLMCWSRGPEEAMIGTEEPDSDVKVLTDFKILCSSTLSDTITSSRVLAECPRQKSPKRNEGWNGQHSANESPRK
jgi:hypothetical protein